MKRILLISAALLLIFGIANAQSEYSIIDKNKPTESSIEIISENSEGITLKLSLNAYKFTEVQTPNGTELVIKSPNGINSMDKGMPDVPYFATSVIIPDNGKVTSEIIASDFITINDVNIAPNKGVIKRSANPDTVPYIYGDCYTTDAYVPNTLAENGEAFLIRDVRGTSVRFYPFSYNPVQKSLKIYKEIYLKLTYTNTPDVNEVTKQFAPISEFNEIYQRMFLNYRTKRTRYTPISEPAPGRMLIICGTSYSSTIQNFVTWKKEKGLDVELVTTSTTGTTASAIKNYITSYLSSHSDLGYILLVGDHADVPTGTSSNDDSDNQYGYLSGNDHYIDVFVGRFSANSTTDVTTQVNKIIYYEKEITTSATWLEKAFGAASSEGGGTSGHNQGHGNESDMTHMGYIQTDLENYGYTVTRSNESGGSTTAISNAFNSGQGVACYIGHGDYDQWYSVSYKNSHVNALTNDYKLPFIFSVACQNGNFKNKTCFAETWLRATNNSNGNPTGAIAFIGSTIDQSWNSPMTAQDEMVDILCGTSTYGGVKRTFAGIAFNGMFKMIEDEGSDGEEMADTWTLFGDPSMPVRTKTPQAITSSNNEMVIGVPYTTTIKIGSTPVENALVCISQNGSYYRGYTNASGQVTITNNFSVGEALLVVTAFNTTTIYQTIPVNSANEPYVSIQSYSPQNVSFGTTNNLSMTLVNMGGVATNGATNVSLTTSDQYLTLNTASATFGTMAAQGGTASSSAFNFTVAENTPDGHVATINATITNGSYTWNGTMNITVAGPACDAPTGLDVAVNGSSATISWDTQVITPVTISDDFEGHTYGTINSAGSIGWTYIDGDGANTGTFNGVSYTNGGSPMAFIVLDDEQMTGSSIVTAHSGDKYLGDAFARSSGWGGGSVQNNDWIISPELNYSENFTFSFYARSYSSSYSTEQFYAAYSTTGNSASDFTNLNSTVVTTTTNWTQYTYNVPANAKYVAIHCVSNDQYIFCVDDITISGNVISGVAAVNIYDNGALVASNITTGSYTANNLTAGEHCFSIRAVCGDNSESMSAQECVNVTSSAPSYTITVNADNGGTVTPSGTQTVYESNSFTFTVTPDDCYEIANVTVDGNNVSLNANNSYTINSITANHTVNATFRQLSYTITASAGDNGSISPAGNVNVNCGDNTTFTITPDEGYEIARVTVDGQNIGSPSSYTFSNVDANHTINATFSPMPAETCYTITGLEVSVETYGNVLNWNAAENAVSYNIYRNNDNTVLANIATTSYIDLSGNVGDSYRIVTVCQHGESESSESVTATPSGIDENSISVNLYPNPTNGSFMIECNGMSSIEVFNMVGQLVKQIDVNTDKASIDASTWAKGVYSIRIATADSNIVVKQLIKQ